MSQARKTTLFCLVTGCVIFVSALYIINLKMVSYCSRKDIIKQARHTLYPGKSKNADHLGYRKLSDTDSSHTTMGSKSRKGNQLPMDNLRESSGSFVHSHSTSHVAKTSIDKDEILKNISFANMRHLMETDGLNNTAFLNWAKSYIFGSQKYSFEMPRWSESGFKVCDNDTELIIIVPAVPHHDFMRILIRQTWASSLYGMHFPQLTPSVLRTKIVFTFGTNGLKKHQLEALKQEALRYNDIVAADFVDSYRNLSLKMMVGLNWVKQFCSGVKYVMKADLDTFVNIPLLSRFLEVISEKVHRFLIGHTHMVSTHPVLRSGRWQIKQEDYPFEVFPPYLLGHSYAFTADLIPLLVYVGQRIPLIPIEDALITGVLARVIEAPRIHYNGFACVFKRPVSCKTVYNYEVSVTRMSRDRLVLMWRDVLTNNCSQGEMPKNLSSII